MSNQSGKMEIIKGLICLTMGIVVLCICGVAYWMFAHDAVMIADSHAYGPVIAIIALIGGGGLLACGVKVMTGYEFE